MAAKFPVFVALRMLDQFSGPLAKSESRLGKFSKSASALGGKLTAGLTVPTLLAGGAIASTAVDYEKSLNRVQVLSGHTDQQMQSLKQATFEAGKEFGATPQKAAQAARVLAQAGITDLTQQIGALPKVMALAASADADLADATEGLTKIATASRLEFDAQGKTVQRVADIITQATQVSTQEFDDVVESMKLAAGTAASLGRPLEETGAALAALGDMGLAGSIGGTTYNSVLLELLQRAPKAQKALSALGVETGDVFDPESGAFRGIKPLLSAIEESGVEAGKVAQVLASGLDRKAFRGLVGFLGMGVDKLEEYESAMFEVGVTQKIAAETMKGSPIAFANLASAVQKLTLKVAESGLIDWLAKGAIKLGNWIEKLSESNPGLLRWGTLIVGGAAAVGPLVLGLGLLAKGLGVATLVTKGLGLAMKATPLGIFLTLGAMAAPFLAEWGPARWLFEKIGAGVAWVVDGLRELVGIEPPSHAEQAILGSQPKSLGRSFRGANVVEEKRSHVRVEVAGPPGTRVLEQTDPGADVDVGLAMMPA